MKAIVYHKYGLPDVLQIEEVSEPIPGDDEVLVKIYAVSINSWDWDTLTGTPFEYRFLFGLFKPKSDRMHGCDIAGKVEKVGKNVKRLKVGDTVFGDLAEEGWGAFAEYISVCENNLTIKPLHMTYEDAASLAHGGNLAVQGLVDYGRVKAGQKVLINGGGGSTGTLAIQIAKLFNAEVTAVDSTEKLDMMRTLGADHVIDFTKEDFTRNGRQYDLIFDVKTNRSYFDYKRALALNGKYVTVGGKTLRILQTLFFGLFCRNRKMQMVSYKANKDNAYLLEISESGRLKPVIDRCFPLEKTAEAFRYYGEGTFKGKIVVVANPTTEI